MFQRGGITWEEAQEKPQVPTGPGVPPALTCVLDDEAGVADGGVAPECQEKAVAAALDPLRELGAVKTPNQGAQGVGPVVDVQEIIARLQAEAAKQRKRARSRDTSLENSRLRCWDVQPQGRD